MNELSDEHIMQDFQSGNTEAIEMIYHRYNNQILNFCLRILGNRADAEDATGEVFLALFSNKYTHNPQAKFSTWLFTVARNSCINRLRKRKRFSSLWFSNKGDKQAQYDVPDTSDTSNELLEKQEAASHVKAAIMQLPLDQREALVLREYHSMSYNEIAQVRHCSLENVKILIFRAREQLRVSLSALMKEAN